MIAGWQRRIDAAQQHPTATLAGVVYPRIRHGAESDGRRRWSTCPDCACGPGQVHVANCDQEQCPRCLGQRLGCGCEELH